MSDEKILDRVRALLAIAEHPNTGEHEADTALRQANKLMAKHAIDEAILRASQTLGERRAPVSLKIKIGGDGNGEFWPMLRTIFYWVAVTNRCKVVIYTDRTAEVFGMDEDVRWVEMLYTTIYFEFLSRLNPKWDESRPFEQNVYNFKVAGYRWIEIDGQAVAAGHPTAVTRGWQDGFGGWHDLKISGRMLGAYKRWAKKIDDNNPVATTNHAAFRRQFGEAYQSRIVNRLMDMEEQNKAQADTIPGAAVALVDSKKDVNEMFYTRFPDHRPEVVQAKQMATRAQIAEDQAEADRKRNAMLDAMTEKQRHDFLEKEERAQRREDARINKRWDEERASVQSSARNLGRAAADKVSLSRYAGKAEGGSSNPAIGS